MNFKSFIFILAAFMCFAMQPVYAAFPANNGNNQTNVPPVIHSTDNTNGSPHYELPIPTQKKKEIHRSGWQGIVSVVCGVLGLFPLTSSILLAAGALLLGFAGLNKKKHKNTGLAIAGIALGVVDVIIWIALISTLGTAALLAL